MSATALVVVPVVGLVVVPLIVYGLVVSDAPIAAFVVLAIFGTVFLTVLGRQAILGVYVADVGVRSRTMLHTWTAPWTDVVTFRSLPSMSRITRGQSGIVIELTGGRSIRTPITVGHSTMQNMIVARLGISAMYASQYDDVLTALDAAAAEAQRDMPYPPRIGSACAQPTMSDRDIDVAAHVLTRKHQRAELTDEEFVALMAALRGERHRNRA
jgi:hypothetical protein